MRICVEVMENYIINRAAMNRVIYVLVMLVLMSSTLTAQSKWTITPKAGVLGSGYKSKRQLDFNMFTGFTLGADIEYRYDELVGISSGLTFSRVGAGSDLFYPVTTDEYSKDTYYDALMKLDYLQIPLLVNWHFDCFSAFAGMQVGIKVNSNLKYHKKTETIDSSKYPVIDLGPGKRFEDYETIVEEKDVSRSASMIKKSEVGLVLGASCELNRFVLSAREFISFYNISKIEGVGLTNRSFIFTLGYKFDLK